MAAPSCESTIARVALMLGKDEDLISDLAMQLEPEDGRLWIYDTDDRDTLGFTVSAVYRPFSGRLDGQAFFVVAQCHGMSSSMRRCGHPLTRCVSTSAK